MTPEHDLVGWCGAALCADSTAGSHSTVYRVVQWTTGKTGSAAVRAMVNHPSLNLVGCYAYSADKVGRDVGELCGVDPIGVIATDDAAALVALRPDCVSYMAYRPDVDQLVQILEAGINVVTTMYMLAGVGYGEQTTTRIAEAAQRGGSSLYASGIYPGHAPTVALCVSAMCARIDKVSILESVDMTGYANENMFRAMGIDMTPDDPAAAVAVAGACGSFRDQIVVMAQTLGVELDDTVVEAHYATANRTSDLGFMTVQRGRIAGFKGVVSGVSSGRSAIECQFVWRLGLEMTPDWPVTNGYAVEIEGDPGVRCRIEPLEGHFDGSIITSMPVINAIPAVCAAPPGIVNAGQLPFVHGLRVGD